MNGFVNKSLDHQYVSLKLSNQYYHSYMNNFMIDSEDEISISRERYLGFIITRLSVTSCSELEVLNDNVMAKTTCLLDPNRKISSYYVDISKEIEESGWQSKIDRAFVCGTNITASVILVPER
ncbi:unnamed protein product [Schistosoma rodhaini]|uniref:Uncharacterized protein n=1 Tax=Schistosoma rodhaini TaxID=6188 RepID=A0AA85GKG9_9TREM|nr:unnamed protein product [Schistosoma rodhaini]